MTAPVVRILYLEDSVEDVELASATLEGAGLTCEVCHVDTRAAFLEALQNGPYDVILSDFRLPDFDGLNALRLVRARERHLPFILVSGTLGEDAAIEALTAGATDYVLKHRLTRLITCVQRALAETAARRERTQAERALRESEARYRSLIETMSDWVWACDLNGTITFSNQASLRVTGYPPAALVNRCVFDFLPERDARALASVWPRAIQSLQLGSRRLRWRHRDGSTRQLDISAVPIVDELGALQGHRGIARDVTEQLQLEAQLRQSQKMEAIGTLAGGIAHDFNNALTTISGFGELVLESLGAEDPVREDVEAILKAAAHSAALTRQLLAFSRRQVLEPVVLDLHDVVLDLEKMLRRVIGENIDLVFLSDRDLGLVYADRGQVEQVLMNLAVNARDAMSHGGKLTIETRNVHLDASYLERHPYGNNGPHTMLSVSDTGYGMDPTVVARIFEPFFTTKPKGKGTGLGLSTVYGIVKQSGGQVEVYSEPGHGTTFKIYFPIVGEAEGFGSQVTGDVDETHNGNETVLVVEDEDSVRTLAQRSLERCGYRVLATQSAEEALSVIEQYDGTIDLLLTDAVLPKLSGPELAQRLESQLSDLKILFVSGYTDDAIVRLGLLNPQQAFLQKPFGPSALLRKVRQVLDGSTTSDQRRVSAG